MSIEEFQEKLRDVIDEAVYDEGLEMHQVIRAALEVASEWRISLDGEE